MRQGLKDRIRKCAVEMLPTTKKTCWWLIKMTVAVSFAVMLLRYSGILTYISAFLEPVFNLFGLPGAAALAYVSGYFVNCYTGIAVMVSLGLNARAMTILGTMLLCSHSMIVETAVLKKTGASGAVVVTVRTLAGFLLAFVLNLLLPGESVAAVVSSDISQELSFGQMLVQWALSTLKLILLMTTIIFTLNFLQRIMNEFGWTDKISKGLGPVMRFFGLPENTAFLWVVANLIGLSYGAAAIMDEIARDSISLDDIKLLDSHISISHSNLEDLSLFASIGGIWWIMLVSRLSLAFLVVWSQRLVHHIRRVG